MVKREEDQKAGRPKLRPHNKTSEPFERMVLIVFSGLGSEHPKDLSR